MKKIYRNTLLLLATGAFVASCANYDITDDFTAQPDPTYQEPYKDYQWGSMNGQPVQRDILRLAYDVDFTDKNIQISTADTLVVQTRESNKKVFFTPQYVVNP